MESLDWPSVYQLTVGVIDKLREANFVPDLIVAVYDPESSGGYVVAAQLASLIRESVDGADPELRNIRIEGRQGDRLVTDDSEIPKKAKRILVVDDVSWSGKTLQLARKHLSRPGSEVKSCALLAGPQAMDSAGVDFFGRISFARNAGMPWGVVGPTGEFRQRLTDQNAGQIRSITWTPRPWGFWEQFAINEPCTVRILSIMPGECLSLQYHRNRDELFSSLDDGLIVQIDDKRTVFNRGDYVIVPRTTVHRLYAPPTHLVRVLEIGFGNYDQAGDIVRLHDKYGRSPDDGSL
jgi:mannose-1-phosphate guanylyltransferase/mannose-6-phosphate isomerase